MNITTTYKTNANGTGQIVAKGAGRQRTIQFNGARTSVQNHGDAAGTLLLALDESDSWAVGDAIQSIDEGNATHLSNDSGTRHTFSV